MYSILKKKIFTQNYFNLLIALLPFSFIAGNMIININIILFVISILLTHNLEPFKLKFYLIDKLFVSFFFLILITGFINDYNFYLEKLSWKGYFSTVVKSILFLKYLLWYFVLRFSIEKEIINFKTFFISSSLAVLFVCFDLFYQYINGVDIFGFEKVASGRKFGGPFGDELIAGSFIQRFSIFTFFLFPIFFMEKTKKYLKYLFPIFFLIFFVGIIISGNRMPLILFLFSIILIVIFQKQTRKYLISFIVLFSVIFYFIFNYNNAVKTNFMSFYEEVSKMKNILVTKQVGKYAPNYYKEFASFYDTWLMNKYIGGGIKNFRYYCHVRPNISKNYEFKCNMHPHNYYLEILTETGLLGFLIVSTIFILTLYISFYKKYFSNSHLNNNHIIIPFIFLFIIEIFPIKSSGSFFTTGNTTYLVFLLAIIIGLSRKENSIESKI